jgi:hypothetical protein
VKALHLSASVIVVLFILLLVPLSQVFAEFDSPPKFINLDNPCNGSQCYFPTQRPTSVKFNVMAIDGLGKDIPVECDQYSGHIFKVGKTDVHCLAKDVFGQEVRGKFTVTIGYEIVDLPGWFKYTTAFWLNEKINDSEYFNSLEYLFKKDIISVPGIGLVHNNTDLDIPSWVTKSAEMWVKNKTGDHEFSIAIQWLIGNGFVKLIK